MALGEAFVTAKADTTRFLPDLSRKLKSLLKGYEAKVKVVPDTAGFKSKLQTAVNAMGPIGIKIIPTNTAQFHATVQREMNALGPIAIHIIPTNTAQFHRTAQAEQKAQAPIGLNIIPVNTAQFHALVQREMNALGPIQMRVAADKLKPVALKLDASNAEIARLRTKIQQQITQMGPIIVPIATGALAGGAAGALGGALGGAAGRRGAAAAFVHQFRTGVAEVAALLQTIPTNFAAAMKHLDQVSKLTAAQLKRDFNLAANAISPPFDRAARHITAAMAAMSNQSNGSIIRMSQVAQREARNMRDSLSNAARRANQELQGSTRRAVDAIIADLRKLSIRADFSFKDVQTAGELAARRVASQFDFGAKNMEKDIARAGSIIANELRKAMASGIRSTEELQAIAARTARSLESQFAVASRGINKALRGVDDPDPFRGLITAAVRANAKMRALFQTFGRSINRRLVNSLIELPAALTKAFLATAAGFAALSTAIAGFGIKIAAEFQVATVALQAVNAGIIKNNKELGKGATEFEILTLAAERTTNQVEILKKFAEETALDFASTADGVKALQALELSFESALSVVETLGNAIALTGKVSGERLQQVMLPFLQAASTGKILGQDLNQLAQRLPGVFSRGKLFAQIRKDMIAAGTATEDVDKKIQAVKDGLEAFDASALGSILKQLQAAPGAAGALRRATTQTLSGAFEAAKESLQQSLAELFEEMLPELTRFVEGFGKQLEGFMQRVVPSIRPLVQEMLKFGQKILPMLGEAMIVFNEFFREIIGPLGGGLVKFFDLIVSALPRLISFFRELFASAKPILGPLGDIVAAILLLSGASLQVLTDFFAGFATIIAPAAELLKVVAAILLEIAQSEAGKSLAFVAGALLGIAGAAGAIVVIRNMAIALAVMTGGVGVGGALGAAAAFRLLGTRILQLGGGIIVLNQLSEAASDLSNNSEGLSTQLKNLFKEDLPEFVKGAGSDIFGGLTQGLDAIDFGLFGDSLTEMEDGLRGVQDRFSELPRETKVRIAVEGADAARREIQTVEDELRPLEHLDSIEPHIRVQIEDALNNINVLQQQIASVPEEKKTQYVAAVSQAQQQVYALLQQIELVPELKQSTILIDIIRRFRTIMEPVGGVTGGSISTGPSGGSGITISEEDAAIVAQERAFNEITTKFGQGIDKAAGAAAGGGGAGESAAKKMADAVKKRAEEFRDFVLDLIKELDRTIREELIKGTAESIKSTLSDLRFQIIDAFEAARKPAPNALLKRIARDSKELQDLAIERERIVEKLKIANDRVAEIAESIRSFGNITDLGLPTVSKRRDASGPAVHAADARAYKNALNDRLKAIQTFKANIEKLIKQGLDRTTIDQLVSAGVEQGGVVAAALVKGDRSTLKAIGNIQKEIDKAGQSIGRTTADFLYDAGKNAGKGFLTGLRSEKAAIIEEMTDIANALVKAIKVALKSKSPSRVTFAEGVNAAQGVILGLRSQLGGIQNAATMAANAATPGLGVNSRAALQARANADSVARLTELNARRRGEGSGSAPVFQAGAIVVSGVSNEATGQKVGFAIGEGILAVMAGQRQTAAINGFGG